MSDTKGKNKKDTGGGGPYQSPVDEAVATALLRSAYTRERTVILQRVIVALSIAISLGIVGLTLVAIKPVYPKYFATGCDGRIIQLTPLDQPMESKTELLRWATDAVLQTFSFDFVNYRRTFQEASQNYTTQGWEALQQAMKTNNILTSVIENKYVVHAEITNPSVILKEGPTSDHRYAWRIQVPMVIKYTNETDSPSSEVTVTITVIREDQATNPRGVGIAQLIMQ